MEDFYKVFNAAPEPLQVLFMAGVVVGLGFAVVAALAVIKFMWDGVEAIVDEIKRRSKLRADLKWFKSIKVGDTLKEVRGILDGVGTEWTVISVQFDYCMVKSKRGKEISVPPYYRKYLAIIERSGPW